MNRSIRWCILAMLAMLILFLATVRVFALAPARPISLPPHNKIPYTDGELNMIANVVNGEVGGICGTVTIYYANGETVEADGQTLRRIHARVVDNQVRHELFPSTVRSCVRQYWSKGYSGTSLRSGAQWQHCRQDALWALWGFVDVPDGVVAATCDPYFANRYPAYRLWATVRWDTGWTSGTFYYYKYGG